MIAPDIQPPRQFRVSIKALITNDQGQLLLHEKNGSWMLPGGGLEHGEQIAEALKREIEEELGVKTTSIEISPCYIWTKEISPNFWMLILTYKTKLESTNFILEDGIKSACFFSSAELKQLTFPLDKQLALDQVHLNNIIKVLGE
jgi:ADP-ribose pyrophosphatase YjhB (NUDIX family)